MLANSKADGMTPKSLQRMVADQVGRSASAGYNLDSTHNAL